MTDPDHNVGPNGDTQNNPQPPGEHMSVLGQAFGTPVAQNAANPGPAGLHGGNLPQYQPTNSGLFFPTATPENPAQNSFLQTIRGIIEEARGQITNDEFLDLLREELPPFRLFNPLVLKKPIFYRRLITLMQGMGSFIADHSEGMTRLMARRLAYTIYDNPLHQQSPEIANDLMSKYQSWNPATSTSPIIAIDPNLGTIGNNRPYAMSPRNLALPEALSAGHNRPSVDKTHHDIRQNYRDKAAKYGGGLDEDWVEVCLEYETTSELYDLTEDQKLRYIANVLKGDALRFYSEKIKTNATSYNEAKAMILNKFNGKARQTQTKIKLQGFRFSQFLNNDTTPKQALTQLSSKIRKLFPQTPASWHSEDNKTEILETAVLDQTWAEGPIGRQAENSMDYEIFYSALANSLQVHTRKASLASSSSVVTQKGNSGIFFNQEQYAFNPKANMRGRRNQSETCFYCEIRRTPVVR